MGEKFTIGIGVNKYEDPTWANLNNCQTDVNNIINVLISKYGFDSPELLFEPSQTTKSAIFNRLNDIFRNCTEADSIFIIFAGHGSYDPVLQSTYWIPADGLANDPSTWLDTHQIINMMRVSPAFHISLVCDACYSGGILSPQNRGGGIQAFASKKSRIAITSGSEETVSDGIAGQGSPFANALVNVLNQNQETEVSFLDICSCTIKEFPGDKVQTPKMGGIEHTGHDGGSFILRLEDFDNKNSSLLYYKRIKLPVKLKPDISFENQCFVPSFLDIGQHDTKHLNFLIQSLAYNAIDQAKDYYTHFLTEAAVSTLNNNYSLEIDYQIHLIETTLVSLTISVFHIFGGPYPHLASYSLTYSLASQEVLLLKDIVDYKPLGSLKEFVSRMFDLFSTDIEQKEIVFRCTDDLKNVAYAYFLTPDLLVIDFTNDLPHAVQAVGQLEIPRSSVKLLI